MESFGFIDGHLPCQWLQMQGIVAQRCLKVSLWFQQGSNNTCSDVPR